jgi:hypothetical protein
MIRMLSHWAAGLTGFLVRRHRARYIPPMRMLVLTILIAATLAACGNVPIGPVNHSCLGNPQRGALGSGCDRG